MRNPQARGVAGIVLVAFVLAGCGLDPVVHRPDSESKQQATSKPVPVPAAGHVVKRGETLYSIATERGIDVRELARWNKLDDPTKIAVGQTLRLSPPEDAPALSVPAPETAPPVQVGAARGPGALEARPLLDAAPGARLQSGASDTGPRTAPKALRLPYSAENLALLTKGAPLPVAKPAAPEGERDPDALDFIWPAKGRVLTGYAEPNSKGVDIGGRIGDPVVAAAAGRVIYAGTGIRGYGKMIVVKHDKNFSSVYAHNKEILVKEGQNVARGQRIAELGDSDSDKPKLHFEIRKFTKPVDPTKYLPANNP